MTNKEEHEICDHVTVSLKEYFEVKLESMEHAITLASTELNRRLEDLNNLRRDYSARSNSFVLREAYEATEREKAVWRDLVNKQLTTIETRSLTWFAALGVFFTFVEIVTAIVLYFMLHK